MRPPSATFLADAWRLFRADWDALTAIVGAFVFVPALAIELLLQPVVTRATNGIDPQDGERFLSAWLTAMTANLPWILAAQMIAQFGSLTIMFFYLDRERSDVGGAMRHALVWLPWYVLAMIAVSFAALPGILLLVIGYFYVLARLAMVGPVMAAERQSGPFVAIARGLKLTRGHGFAMTSAVLLVMLGGYFAQSPFNALDQWMNINAPNPIALAIVDIFGAGFTALAALALTLVQVAAYRRLS